MTESVQALKDRIETLTEQLEAARADAKEAEAYAEELQGDLTELCRQLIAAEDKLAECLERNALLEARLGKAAEALEIAVIRWDEHQKYGMGMSGDWVEEARATLAEIEGSDAP